MRTNIVIDDKLLQEAFKYTSFNTKKALIELALREFVENHQRQDIRELVGQVKLSTSYDYKTLRKDQRED